MQIFVEKSAFESHTNRINISKHLYRNVMVSEYISLIDVYEVYKSNIDDI